MLGLGNSIISGAALDEFTPANIANLALWLKNATGVTVAQWDDSSGNNNNATQDTSGNQAAVSGGGLDFEKGEADHYDLDDDIEIAQNENILIGFVISPEAPDSTRNCLIGDANGEFIDVRINKIAVNCGGAETTFTGDANLFSDGTKAAVVISRNDGATGTFNIFVNGSTPAGSYNAQTNPDPINFDEIGVRNGSGRPFDGILHELVVYDLGTGTHTADELTALNNYLTSKFGL